MTFQHIRFAQPDNPATFAPELPLAITFKGDIQGFLSDPRNVEDLEAVLKGNAIIVRLNPRAT